LYFHQVSLPSSFSGEITVASICGGILTEQLSIEGLKNAWEIRFGTQFKAKLNVKHVFTYESNKKKLDNIIKMHPELKHAFLDAKKMNQFQECQKTQRMLKAPSSRIIVSGFPCQGLSIMNAEPERFSDCKGKTGSVWPQIVKYVELTPEVEALLLENVIGLVKKRKQDNGERPIDILVKKMRVLGFKIRWSVTQALEYGLPASRIRVYVCAIRTGFGDPEHFPDMMAAYRAQAVATKRIFVPVGTIKDEPMHMIRTGTASTKGSKTVWEEHLEIIKAKESISQKMIKYEIAFLKKNSKDTLLIRELHNLAIQLIKTVEHSQILQGPTR
jgi:site-specific DNA-cytosine methylase